MEFSSVREINKACRDAALGNLRGKYVYVKTRDTGSLTARFKRIRIARARSDKYGGLSVQLLGTQDWYACAWADVITA